MNVCIFGGTSEGRLLAEFLCSLPLKVDLYIATEYGQQFVKGLKDVNIHRKRLSKEEMIELFQQKSFDCIVDATHPFAKIVSENIVKATESCKIKYYRIVRETSENKNCIYFDCMESIVNYLNKTEGNILLTTGSKDLDKFTKVENYKNRIYVRILPMEDSLKKAIELGYSNKNIICMQGPFSQELNIAMINSLGAKMLVTKESSSSGGFEEKVEACIKSSIPCLVFKKPEEEGISLEEFKKIIRGLV